MRRKVLCLGGALILAAMGWFASPLRAESAPQAAEIQEAFQRGQQLESQRRWGEAVAHYEEAVRHYPGERGLESRLDSARLHFDLGRRYGDASFGDTLRRLSPDEALALYNDVLLKLQSHYVESPDWKMLVRHGLSDLQVALTEDAFLSRNVPENRRGEVASLINDLQQNFDRWTLANRGNARDAVAFAAQQAEIRAGIPFTATVLEFTCGATNALDQYSTYLTPSQLAEVYSQIEGNFVGLGVELKVQDGALLIVRVIPNSPAFKAEIHAGDSIVAVDGRAVRDFPNDQAANLLQGEAGSMVEVSVVTPGQAARSVRVQRQKIDVPSIDDARILDADRGIAYLKLVCFQKHTIRELDAALWQLHRGGMRSLIIDLRGNPGGLLVTAVEAVDRFVDHGIIVSTRGRNAQEDFTYSAHEEGTWRVPLVVLIDQDSASAAEIFAGAIRDHHRGAIVGCRSYGKGSVQGIFPLSVTSAGVRLTTARFYSPTGRPYNKLGVDADVVVRKVAKPVVNGQPAPAAPNGDDPALTAAIQQAASQMAFAPR